MIGITCTARYDSPLYYGLMASLGRLTARQGAVFVGRSTRQVQACTQDGRHTDGLADTGVDNSYSLCMHNPAVFYSSRPTHVPAGVVGGLFPLLFLLPGM